MSNQPKITKIKGCGYYLPHNSLSNTKLAEKYNLDTSDEWIRQRVGIESRHIAEDFETTTSMGILAAKDALNKTGVLAESIDLIIVATSTPDDLMPSIASNIQAELNIKNCIAFDISATCAGFMYALHTAHQFFKAGSIQTALIIGSEKMSSILDWSDRSTCVLFGDGAAAVILESNLNSNSNTQNKNNSGIINTCVFSEGKNRDLLYLPSGLEKNDLSKPYLNMTGNKVFKHAVSFLERAVESVLDGTEYRLSDIDYLIPHQANLRIIKATAQKLKLSESNCVITLPTHGNTSAASIPLAMAVSWEKGDLKPGQLIVLEAFGAGFVWGAALIRL